MATICLLFLNCSNSPLRSCSIISASNDNLATVAQSPLPPCFSLSRQLLLVYLVGTGYSPDEYTADVDRILILFRTRLILLSKSCCWYLVCSVSRKLEVLWLRMDGQVGQQNYMKEHNALVRFKNSFISDPQKQEKLGNILTDDPGDVIGKKMEAVQTLYRSQAAENGYEAELAYRVIVIHLLSGTHKGLDIKAQVNRLFKHCLGRGKLQDLRLCFDLLLLKELTAAMGSELRLLKVRILRGLRDFYSAAALKKEKKKCARMLQEYSRDALSRDEIKRTPEAYSEILDALLEQTKRRVSTLIRRGGKMAAVEQLSNFVQVLERSQQIVSRKYQLQLMEAYWSLAVLHEQLHYQAYTKKYATIALNIAERTEMHSQAAEIRQLLERLL